jgi:hypothetical protein
MASLGWCIILSLWRGAESDGGDPIVAGKLGAFVGADVVDADTAGDDVSVGSDMVGSDTAETAQRRK